ncbi:DUF4198 domain-containing protein [Oleiharenicola lentus]|uniref:DUF4198 domain-containing protein n=1 Tax=Oleiharenicola lentus TaxID=2508720 RepID=UPI003F676D07
MKKIVLLAGLFTSALSLFAHDTWLQATAPAAKPGGAIALQLTSGNGFKGIEFGPQADRVQLATLHLAGKSSALTPGTTTEKFLPFSSQPAANGVAVFSVELKPRVLELKPELIEEYLEEIHALPAIRTEWEKIPAPKVWRERYTKSAKTFVRVGEPIASDRTWAEITGLSLEIIPERDPTTLRAGDVLSVRVLKHGKPFAGLPLGFVADGETHHHIVTTDQDGRAAAPVNHPGRWLVHGTDLYRANEKDLEWESLFTTLVVDVAPAK